MLEPHRVVHRNVILASGVTGRELTEFVRTGVITRLWRGMYTTGTPIGLPDPRGVTRSMKVVLSHESGVAWQGGDLVNPVDGLHVTGPRNRGRVADCAPGIRLHRADLVPSDVIKVRGVAVTTPERTVIDIARTKPLDEAVAIADGLCRARRLDLTKLSQRVAAMPVGPGRSAAQRVGQCIDPKAGSIFESLTRVKLVLAGLAPPESQYHVYDRTGALIGRVDFAWPEARLILECDGFEHHGERDAFVRDRRRWTALARAHWVVAIVTWNDVVGDPSYLTEVVSDLIAA